MFTQGDPALIIKAHHDENLMRSVTLLHCSTDAVVGFGKYRTENPLRERVWIVCGNLVLCNYFGFLEEADQGVIPEKHLMSLSGDFDDEVDVYGEFTEIQRELIKELKRTMKDRKGRR